MENKSFISGDAGVARRIRVCTVAAYGLQVILRLRAKTDRDEDALPSAFGRSFTSSGRRITTRETIGRCHSTHLLLKASKQRRKHHQEMHGGHADRRNGCEQSGDKGQSLQTTLRPRTQSQRC